MRGYKITEADRTVLGMRELELSGNVIPVQWLKTITHENGRPNLVACVLLSDLVYWHRPIIVRDEETGAFLGWRKRFKGDKLQRNYRDLAATYGLTKRQVADNMRRLRDLGVVLLEFRTVEYKPGKFANNVLFVDLDLEVLRELSLSDLSRYNGTAYHVTTEEPITLQRKTNTENTLQRSPNSIVGDDADGTGSEKKGRKKSGRDLAVEALEQAFAKETGLRLPPRRTKNEQRESAILWWKPLEAMYRDVAGFGPSDRTEFNETAVAATKRAIADVVTHFREEGLTIKGPISVKGSVLSLVAEERLDQSDGGVDTSEAIVVTEEITL